MISEVILGGVIVAIPAIVAGVSIVRKYDAELDDLQTATNVAIAELNKRLETEYNRGVVDTCQHLERTVRELNLEVADSIVKQIKGEMK